MRRLIFLPFYLFFFTNCENSEENIINFIEDEIVAVEKLKNSEIIYTENGILKVKVVSNVMERFSEVEDRIELFDGVKFFFYKTDSKRNKSVLTCQNAVINNTKNIMIANQNVILLGSDKKELKTEQLIWDKGKNIIYTDLAISIRTEEEIIMGVGFKSTPDFTDYEINNVKGTFTIKHK